MYGHEVYLTGTVTCTLVEINMLRVTGLGVLWLLWGVSASAAPDLEARFDLIPSLPLVAGVGLRTGRHDERRALLPVSSLSLCLVL